MKRWIVAGVLTAGAAGAALAYVTPPIFDEDPVVLGPDSGFPLAVVVADVTGDGKLDVIDVAERSANVYVHPGLGDGRFGDVFALTAGPELYTRVIVAGRLNGDAYDDLVLNHAGSARVDVLLSDGAGGYALARLPAVDGPATVAEYQALADWDGDGDLDIVTSGRNVRLRRNDGSGAFSTSEILYTSGPSAIGSPILVADLDGDNRLDVLVQGVKPGVLWRQSDGTLGAGSTGLTGGHGVAIACADFDRDGRMDIATTKMDQVQGNLSGVDVFLQTSARTFEEPVFLGGQFYDGAGELEALDVNADGWMDLAGTNRLYMNDGTGALRLPDPFAFDETYWANRGNVGMSTGDLDGDARPEIVMTDYFGKTFVFSTHADEPPGIAIESIAPSSIGPGATQVTFTGVSFPASVTVDLGRGIAVSNVVRESSTTVTATATVPATARPVTRIAIVRGGSTSVATIPFRVVNAATQQVTITSLTPGSLRAGESASVVVDGSGFHAPVDAGLLPGVHVTSVTVDSPTRLTLAVDVVDGASPGLRTLHVSDDWGDAASLPGALEVRAAPTLVLAQTTGRVHVKARAGRDAFSVAGTLAFGPLSPDGTFDPSSEAVSIRFGDAAAPALVEIPALAGWRVRRGRATWKSPRRAHPRVTFSVDLSGGTFRVDVTRADLVVAGPDVQLALELGAEQGADLRPWETAKGGLRLR